MNTILKEAEHYHGLGFAVHWIRPNSKVPVKGGWSGAKRDDLEILVAEYQEGYGLGVRLGEPSRIPGGYLAVIDVDVKSGKREHYLAALKVVDEHHPGICKIAPYAKTGRGFHIYVCTDQPVPSMTLKTSDEQAKVFMPNEPINQKQYKAVQYGVLSEQELKKGFRARPAWQVEFMSIGKQVVMPPTIHPDTGKPYVWRRGLTT